MEIGNAPRLGMFQFNDNPDSVEGIIYLRRGENVTEVLARVRNTVDNINKHVLPPGIEVKPFYDRQVLLDITIGTVKHTLFFWNFIGVGGSILLPGECSCSCCGCCSNSIGAVRVIYSDAFVERTC